MEKKPKITVFGDGVEVRLHNRRIQIKDSADGFIVYSRKFDQNAEEGSIAFQSSIRGKIKTLEVHWSDEAMKAIVAGMYHYFEGKEKL